MLKSWKREIHMRLVSVVNILISCCCICVLSNYMILMQIIERSLPKKQIVKREHSEIVKEDLLSFLKRWQIIVRNMPKHHRNFSALLKKRQMDAKRFSENCQREVLHLSIVALQHGLILQYSSLCSC